MIEEHVSVWSGFGADTDVEGRIAEVVQAKKDAKKARYAHEYTCTRCGKLFTHAMEFDLSRPIYCEECKPIIDAERQKAKERSGKKLASAPKAALPPPRVAEGEIVAPQPPEQPVSLSALAPEPTPIRSVPPAPAPVAPVQAVVAPTASVPATDPAKKKRRRRRKPSDGAREQTLAAPIDRPPLPPLSVPTPQSPTKPILPGEKITF